MNKVSLSRAAYVAIALALVAVLAFLIAQTRTIDREAYNDIITTLRELKQLDAEWNVDVLRAKTGLSNNYDQVARPLPLIESLKEKLSVESPGYWRRTMGSDERLLPLLERFSKLMDDKISGIEQFKSQDAILRNSSRFLPMAATDVGNAARDSNLPPDAKMAVERLLNNLMASTMSYSQTPDETLRSAINADTDELTRLAANAPQEVRDHVETLVAHVGTMLRQQDRGALLLTELSALPTAKAIDDLTDAHARENDQLLAQQQIFQRALVGYSAFLLALLAFAAWRLFRYYQALNQTNAVLEKTNQELKESHVHLVQAEKMSALGQMVAGIAHEINTPLAYVKGTFSVLKDQLNPIQALATQSYGFTQALRAPNRDKTTLNQQFRSVEGVARNVVEQGVVGEMDSLLKDGIHGIEQISEIVLNLKNFSRLDREKVSNFSVEEGLDSTLLLARNLLKNRVEVRKEYGHVPQIIGSPSQINQVFLNIITNAVHAMPERTEPNVITLHTSMEDQQTVRIDIEDNGKGIPEDVLPKIFDPFFTTKPIGQGTGMGLSISYKIIQEHQGRITVDTKPGLGTTFSIFLPTVVQPRPASSEPAPHSTVDDEDLLFAD